MNKEDAVKTYLERVMEMAQKLPESKEREEFLQFVANSPAAIEQKKKKSVTFADSDSIYFSTPTEYEDNYDDEGTHSENHHQLKSEREKIPNIQSEVFYDSSSTESTPTKRSSTFQLQRHHISQDSSLDQEELKQLRLAMRTLELQISQLQQQIATTNTYMKQLISQQQQQQYSQQQQQQQQHQPQPSQMNQISKLSNSSYSWLPTLTVLFAWPIALLSIYHFIRKPSSNSHK